MRRLAFNSRWAPTRRVVVALAALVVILVVGMLANAHRPRPQPSDTRELGATTRYSAGRVVSSAPAPQPDADVEADLARLSAVEIPLQTGGSGAESRIPQTYRQQPDLYARAFVEQLLTQDYSAARDRHLAWVQSESAPTDEPLVTGLIPPELRDRLAIFSVTDERSGPAPVPSRMDWDKLRTQHAHTTVVVQRVNEPLAWSNAVEAGRVTDPGVTAREVAATVTQHTGTGAHVATRVTSVDLTLNLLGPPTRGTWAFVAVITYRAVPLGPQS
jgi:hypothetical protein